MEISKNLINIVFYVFFAKKKPYFLGISLMCTVVGIGTYGRK